jgi:hypothetical protein
MAKWTKAKRDKLSLDNFGDPKRRLFPIEDQEDLDHAAKLIGKAKSPSVKERLIAIAKRLKLTLPKAWETANMERNPTEPIDLAGSFLAAISFDSQNNKMVDGDYVVYKGCKLFEEGDYPSHDFEMGADELALVADTNGAATLDLDHKPTVIRDDMIGSVNNFSTAWDEDKLVLYGDVRIHKLLDPLLKDETKLSVTWDRDSRQITKTALLLNPRIPDAALNATYAAFKKEHTTRSGQQVMQQLHDIAAKSGAVCDMSNVKEANMASKGEHKAMQAIHDMATANGAECEGSKSNLYGTYYFGDDSGKTKETSMDPVTDPKPSAEFAAMQKRVEELEADLKRKSQEARQSKAAQFAERLVQEERIAPGLEGIVAEFAEACLEDDELRSREITFSADKKGSRLDALATILAARQPHGLTKETVKTVSSLAAFGAKVLSDDDADDNDSAGAAKKRMGARARKLVGASTGNGMAAVPDSGNGKAGK